jgi:RimJ/RimL family protein N-acetyltransferase
MKLNYETVLVGTKCVLVPYRKEHVLKYHEWMQDPKILETTGSEPLCLQEEYDMQESWRNDPEKCTFIVLSREKVSEITCSLPNAEEDENDVSDGKFVSKTLPAMAGDVNLFLSDEEEEEVDPESASSAEAESSTAKYQQAELDIMVAEKSHQRTGIGREACCIMMLYAARNLRIRRFFVKINEDNESSLSLFRTTLGFEQCAYAACFKQYELELKRDSPVEMIASLTGLLGRRELVSFHCPAGEENLVVEDS